MSYDEIRKSNVDPFEYDSEDAAYWCCQIAGWLREIALQLAAIEQGNREKR